MPSIDSVLQVKRVIRASDEFVAQANVSGMKSYQSLCAEAGRNYEGFWARLAHENICWHKPFTHVLDESNAPFYKWFSDGELNVSYNCLDRHLATQPNKIAIIFEADDGAVTKISYQELYQRVCQLANGLKSLNVKQGDRVIIYMPTSIEGIVAMQACARIGAIHSVVFGGFSAKSLHERIIDTGAVAIITADGQRRGNKPIALKPAVDEAIAMGGIESVHSVVVYQHTGVDLQWHANRDIWWHDLISTQPDTCVPTWVNAEHPLFILYTSGSTGKPKGLQHSTGGYLLGTTVTMKWVFDYKASDVFWCTADLGWVTGHSYTVYGALAVGATTVIFEGIPTYPDAGRFWKIIQNHRVNVFYTSPTIIRSLIKLGPDLPQQYDLSSLRLLGSVGEPINPQTWMWYYEVVGQGRCPIVDTWWQTETGSQMIAPVPGAVPLKPGSCTLPLPGISAVIVDKHGTGLPNGKAGLLVITRSFPSQARSIWGDPERYKQIYFPDSLGGKYYLAGDSSVRDRDGYFWIMGRIDDVLNVSGHHLGTMEIESALVANPLVAEAAVIGKPHEIKGEAIVAFVVLKGQCLRGSEAGKTIAKLRDWVSKEISPIAKPDEIYFTDTLPKTRSGKIMRRLLRTIANGEEVTQDISTLENPSIFQELKDACCV